jgi:hypothetical protein
LRSKTDSTISKLAFFPIHKYTEYMRHYKTILVLDENYRVEFVETFDLNPVDSSRRSYKDRLKADYYIVSKLLP